ncbi:MAG: fibronectin type III domain-containing protein [Acidimicrobiales bacterium]
MIRRRRPVRVLTATWLVFAPLVLLAGFIVVATPGPASATEFPTYYANGEDSATWLDGSGQLQGAWIAEHNESDPGGGGTVGLFDLLIARHTLAGARDPSWGTDSLTGTTGLRRIVLDPPGGAGYQKHRVDAVGADDAGNITIAWNVSYVDGRGTVDYGDDLGISEAVLDRYSPDGVRTARRTVAHHQRLIEGGPGRPETYVSEMVSLPDGSIAEQEATATDFQPTGSRIIWYGTAGETRTAFSVGPTSAITAASTNGDGRLYVTTDDGVLRRSASTGVESFPSGCRNDQTWRGPFVPVAGPAGTFATVCGSGYSTSGVRGILVRRYSATGTLTSSITSSPSAANRAEVFRPTGGAFDGAGRLWVGGHACTMYSGTTVECRESGPTRTAVVSAFDATKRLTTSGFAAAYEGYRVDGMRPVSGNRITYVVPREAFNGGNTVSVDLLPGSTPPPPVTVPGQPAAPTGVAGPGRVAVSWAAPSDGGSPITGYRLTPYRNGVAQAPVDVGAVTSYTFTGLTNGAAYRFTVAARNAQGLGPASAQSTAVTPAGPPGAPTGLRATPGAKSATVTWTAPVDDGGSVITGYLVKLIANGRPLQNFTTGSATTFTANDLKAGNTYTFEVAAVTAAGTGPWSATSNPAAPPPDAFPKGWPAAVTRQYQDLTGRAPTSTELVNQVNQLQSGQKPAGALPAELRQSADHQQNVDPTTRLYDSYFLRIPDPGGLDYWIGRKRAGDRLVRISAYFAASSEFKRRYGSLDNEDFVRLVYRNVLKREGDPAGIRFWTQQLDQRRRDRGDVMAGFSESSEHIRKEQYFVTVDVLYIFMLDRAPTVGELDTEASTLAGGGTVTALADRIIASTEYANRIARLP